ncbi:MAG TPA: PAS domain S-box protein [Gemmatimonadales bacterium]|nr:PAS domain S-box protein [Gemmatimonadales bacterium]
MTLTHDPIERGETERALARYRLLSEHASDIMFFVRPDGRIAEANRAAVQAYGYTREELLGLTVFQLRDPAERELVTRQLAQAAAGSATFETFHRRKDGTTFPVEVSSQSADVAGERLLFSVVRDVSERKRVERALRESEERFRTIANAAPALIWLSDTENLCTWFNQPWLAFTGRPLDQELGQGWMAGIHPDDLERYTRADEDAFVRRVRVTQEFRLRRHDGEYRWILEHGEPILGPDGAFAGFAGTCVDVTERKRAEEELQRRTAVLQAVIESTPDAVFVKDRESRMLMANPATLEVLGIGADEIPGTDGVRGMPAELRNELLANDRRVLETGRPGVFEERLPGGRTYLSTKSPYRDADGEIIGLIGISRDISERIRIERRRTLLLEISRLVLESPEAGPALTRTIFERIREPLGADACFNYRLVDGGLRLETSVGVPDALQESAERLELNQAFCGTVAATCAPIMADALRIAQDPRGEFVRQVEATAYACHPLFDSGGRVLGTFSVASRGRRAFSEEDVDFLQTICHFLALAWERRDANAALRQNEAQLRLALAASRAGIWSWDVTSPEAVWSPENYALYGFDPADGPVTVSQWEQRIHPDDLARAVQAVRDAVDGRTAEYRAEFRIVHPERGVRWLIGIGQVERAPDGTALRMSGINLDITDRRETEARLHQAQRVQSVGRLAGGIAHEVNNLMTVVLGFGNFALDQLEAGHPARGEIDQMIRAGERAATITRQLLAFTRQQVLRPARLDLNAVVRDLAPMLERLLGAEHRLVLALGGGLGTIAVDRGQLEQVLVNLALNSRDAMGQPGALTITTGTADLTDEPAWRHPGTELRRGRYLVLGVDDTGIGMDEATRTRVFEPFFTTKPVGQGTGLGLSTVYGIVKQSGGYIWLYSEPGHGTSVKVYLPMFEAAEPSGDGAAPPERTRRAEGELVLVAEDEPLVRLLARRTLEMHGYRVLEAADGRAALQMLEQAGGVDLMVSDAVMPHLSGRALGEIIAARWPGLPVLYMSGYPGKEVVDRGLVNPDAPFIAKPFTPEALARRVREVLDGAGARAR